MLYFINILVAAIMLYPVSFSSKGLSTRSGYGVSAVPVMNYPLHDPVEHALSAPFMSLVEKRDADDVKKKANNNKAAKENKANAEKKENAEKKANAEKKEKEAKEKKN